MIDKVSYRMNGFFNTEKDSQAGLRWNSPDKMKQGRPKMTLRKTIVED